MHNLNFTRLIGLVFLCSRLILRAKATTDATHLPECTFSASNAPCNDSSGGNALTSTTYCIDTSVKIYKSTAAGGTTTGSCELLQNGTIKIFECSNENTCIDSSTYADEKKILAYKKSGTTWTQNAIDYYYDDGTTKVLIKCATASGLPGACDKVTTTSTTDEYYLLTSSNSNLNSNALIKISSSDPKTKKLQILLDTI